MKKSVLFQLFAWSIVLITMISCSENTKQETVVDKPTTKSDVLTLTGKQVLSFGIKSTTLTKSFIGMSIFANGMIDVPPQNKSYISVPFGGYIRDIKVLDGMRVSKGDVLLVVEHPEIIQLQQDYLEVQGNMEFLKAEMDRQKSLLDKEAGSAKNYQLAKSNWQVAQAKLAGLNVKLQMANVNIASLKNGVIQREQKIKSPFAGVVTKVNTNVGSFADPKDNLLEVIDLQHAHAELTVYEKYLKMLKMNQLVNLTFIDSEEKTSAKIFLIGREIGSDRTVKVHCHFEHLPKEIVPGSYLKAEINVDEMEHFVVPTESIVSFGGKDVLYVTADNRHFIPVEIEILSTQGDRTAIQPVNEMDFINRKYVSKGAYELLSTMNKEDE
ncbi:MAG: efflux RND transporter periplasmic adaptor subunit [Flavobacteriales bacterium]